MLFFAFVNPFFKIFLKIFSKAAFSSEPLAQKRVSGKPVSGKTPSGFRHTGCVKKIRPEVNLGAGFSVSFPRASLPSRKMRRRLFHGSLIQLTIIVYLLEFTVKLLLGKVIAILYNHFSLPFVFEFSSIYSHDSEHNREFPAAARHIFREP